MIARLPLALALAASLASAAAAQPAPFWSGTGTFRCHVEVASTCDGTSCVPLSVARIVLVELAANRICASRDGATCAFRYYPITRSDQAGRLLLVVQATGTSYSIGSDGRMSGASVVAPQAHIFLGRCAIGAG